MNTHSTKILPQTVLAAALALAFGPATAQDDDVKSLTKPSSSIEVGVGAVSDDNQRFGQYTGLNEKGGYGIANIDYVTRDDLTGTWMRLTGRNLGFDNREVRFENNRQGNWGYFVEYNQIPRFDPYTVTTQLTGIGTTTQNVAGGAAREYHFKTERNRLNLGFEKQLAKGLALQVTFKNEEKEGNRLWGQGTFGTWRFLADPIDQTTNQLEAKVNFTTENFQLSGGYYGTAFKNKNNVLNVPGCALFTGCDQMGLPPDNESHQLYLAGGYSLSKATRANFKVAYGRITQNEAYATTPIAGAPGSLNGQIDTMLLQGGLTTSVTPALSMRADLRYEDRDDKTPVFVYFPSNFSNPLTATSDGTNEPRDIKTVSGKLEASYRLPANFRLKGGVDYAEKTRNSPPVRSVSFRKTTDETTLFGEVRRSISETVTGAVSLLHSERGGSEWLINTFVSSASFATSSNQVAPLHLADRDRDTLRLVVNWLPADPLALNFRVDESKDKYSGRGFSVVDQAARKGKASNYSVDAAYSVSDTVQLTAWYSVNDTGLESQLCRSSNGDVCTPGTQQVWASNVRTLADSFGVGARAKIGTKIELSGDLSHWKARDDMLLSSVAGTAVVDTLDDINTKVTTIQLAAKYALQRNAAVRVTYIHDEYKTDDWTWASWNYSPADGGTTVRQDPNQKVDFVGVSYLYRF